MRVLVARIGRPHGLAGDVTVSVTTDEPELRLAAGATVILVRDGGETSTRIDRARLISGRLVVRLAGIEDRGAAEESRGADLYADVDPDARPSGEDEWYDRQLIGLACRGTAGNTLGEVIGVEHPPGHDLLVVRLTDERVARVPFVSAMVPVVDEQGLVIDPPAGLLDEESAETGEDRR
ncbi:MAG: ribosome maturation factor RimM [Candidatus Nanopelagicales bacterium]|nr:ribosome maturation factor RimM [Candidatus Nanopelagicales bacterium]